MQELIRKAEAEWHKMDLLLLPTTGTIYTIDQVNQDPVRLNTNLGYYTNFVNLMDLAALAIPAGFRKTGLPFGVSLIAPAFSDEALLNVAERYLADHITVAVVGAHLRGQPLNWQLTDRGAKYPRDTTHRPELPPVRAHRHCPCEARTRTGRRFHRPRHRSRTQVHSRGAIRRLRRRHPASTRNRYRYTRKRKRRQMFYR